MAKNVVIRDVTYQNVPSVEIPLADDEGTAKFFDCSDGKLQASDLRKDVVGYGENGKVVGSLDPAVISYDSDTKVLSIS